MTKRNVEVVISGEEKPLDIQILQSHIVILSDAAKDMMECGLKDETIVLLLHDSTKVSKGHIRKILEALPELKSEYTNLVKAKK